MIYLDNAATTLHKPPCVIDAVVQGLGILEEKSKALQAQKKGA